MSEERTPIEELILDAALFGGTIRHDKIQEVRDYFKDQQAYREKYKHTKEDVIEGVKYGMYLADPMTQNAPEEAEGYHNETHNK